ncbi:MAG TPA: hypothetical protein VJ773_01425 [Gemmatimonadales bacterium]|nr:hypothetical protein [Gemmatimonadales bacterium]
MTHASVRAATLALAIFLAHPVDARAQQATPDLTLPGAVLEREVDRDQPVTVLLSKRFIYTATVDLAGAGLSLQTTGPRPLRGLAARMEGPEGATRFEVYAARDGEHVLTLTGFGSRARVRLRVEVDSVSTAARQRRDAAPRLTVGLEAALGAHGGYAAFGPSGPSGSAGVTEVCLSFRYGHRVGGCLGYSREAIRGSEDAFGFYFGEARVTALGRPDRGPFTAGLSARVGQGGISGVPVSVDPMILSLGIWAAWWPVHSTTGRGLALRGSLAVARYGNLMDEQVVENPTPPLPGEPPLPPIVVPVSGSEVAPRLLFSVNWHP